MASSMYVSLEGDSRNFRLLVLEPSADRLSPVRCKLQKASFDDNDLKYTALSYVWGDPPGTTSVIVNGIKIQVTLNLEEALRHVRKPSCAMVLWVDALCINQGDTEEKNHQVEMMREIYSRAEVVIAWLGSSGDDSEVVMDMVNKGLKEWAKGPAKLYESAGNEGLDYETSLMIHDQETDDEPAGSQEKELSRPELEDAASVLVTSSSDRQPFSPGIPADSPIYDNPTGIHLEHQDDDHIGDESSLCLISRTYSNVHSEDIDDEDLLAAIKGLTAREAFAIRRFLTRSWWSRIWVAQEVILAKKVLFKCGDSEVNGARMRDFGTGNTLVMLQSQIFDEDSDSNRQLAYTLGFFSHLKILRFEESNTIDCLFFYGMREATIPHDHIYGLLGIIPAEDRKLLETPNYDCRLEDLFINVATKLMVEHNSLALLLLAGIDPCMSAALGPTRMELPSWVPDWRLGRASMGISRYGSGFRETKLLTEPAFFISEDLKELMLEGFKLDVIESVKSVPSLGQGELPIWQTALGSEEKTGKPPLQRLILALLPGIMELDRLHDESTFPASVGFFQELEEYRISLLQRQGIDDCENDDYLAGFLSWTKEERNGRTDEEILAKVFGIDAAQGFVEWYHGARHFVDPDSEELFYKCSRNEVCIAGFSAFRTCNGAFGLMQMAPVAGDLICAVPGCRLPLVLREVQSSKYLLVGPTSPIPGHFEWEIDEAVDKGELTRAVFTLV